MAKAKYDEGTLPKWAQALLEEERHRRRMLEDKMGMLRQTHMLLTEFEGWFTLNFGGSWPDGEVRHLWIFEKDDPRALCTLTNQALVIVGRKRRTEEGYD